MTYDPNIPIGEISPMNQVVEIMTNFAQFQDVYEVNHTDINTTNQGDHEDIYMTVQTSDPDVTDNYNVIYARNATSALGTQPQLFSRIPVFLPNDMVGAKPGNLPMQITYNEVNTSGPMYQSFLLGGYLIYWGSSSAVNVPITLVPTPTAILDVIANLNTTPVSGILNAQVSVTIGPTPSPALTAAQFQINSSISSPYSYSWMAIAIP